MCVWGGSAQSRLVCWWRPRIITASPTWASHAAAPGGVAASTVAVAVAMAVAGGRCGAGVPLASVPSLASGAVQTVDLSLLREKVCSLKKRV